MAENTSKRNTHPTLRSGMHLTISYAPVTLGMAKDEASMNDIVAFTKVMQL